MARSEKVIVSLAVGSHVELLELAARSYESYASRHSYDLHLETVLSDPSRPASWNKLPLIGRLMNDYDLVVWIDSDAVVVQFDVDIADLLPRSKHFGMVAHKTLEGDEIPNAGIMVLRRSRTSRRFLSDAYARDQYIEHKWWDNAAILDLLGYTTEAPVTLMKPTRYRRKLQVLPTEWNFIPGVSDGPARIRHYAGSTHEERVAGMTADLEIAGLL